VVFATRALQPAESKVLIGSEQAALLVGENTSDGSVKSSWLTADKIELSNIDANLVVLSACNTGAPEKDKGSALSGLARAFFAAGARGVMATTWYIDASKTRDLLIDIAESIKAKDGMRLPDAMQAVIFKRARDRASNLVTGLCLPMLADEVRALVGVGE
jgi:CHAT domain-containing protein